MDKMSVFSDVVNESFNYSEIEWGGNSYLVDFHNRESLVKLIKAVTGETDLNEDIKKLPDELLEQTSYSKFQRNLVIEIGSYIIRNSIQLLTVMITIIIEILKLFDT